MARTGCSWILGILRQMGRLPRCAAPAGRGERGKARSPPGGATTLGVSARGVNRATIRARRSSNPGPSPLSQPSAPGHDERRPRVTSQLSLVSSSGPIRSDGASGPESRGRDPCPWRHTRWESTADLVLAERPRRSPDRVQVRPWMVAHPTGKLPTRLRTVSRPADRRTTLDDLGGSTRSTSDDMPPIRHPSPWGEAPTRLLHHRWRSVYEHLFLLD